MNNKPTLEIITALDHVRTIFPTVTMVAFNKFGQHQFMDDNFNAPTFDERIDNGIIEDATDSIYHHQLPAIFHLFENE